MKVFRYTGLFMPPRGAKPEPPKPPVPEWTLIARDFHAGGNNQLATMNINTVGANLIVVQAWWIRSARPGVGLPGFGSTPDNGYQLLPIWSNPSPNDTNWYLRAFVSTSPSLLTDASHYFWLGWTGFVPELPYPTMHVSAFHCSTVPSLYAWTGNALPNASAIGPVPPVDIPFPGALCLSAAATGDELTGMPEDYDVQLSAGSFHGSGYRVRPTSGVENPVWTDGITPLVMNLLVFRGTP